MVVIDMLKGKLSATSQNLCGSLSTASQNLCGSLSTASAGYILQDKTIVPGAEEQTITADIGYTALSKVTVAAIPSNYGRISFNGYELKVE